MATPLTLQVNDQGQWSHAIAANTLTDGTYSYTATTVDAAGNPTERTGSFRVDTQMSVAIDSGFAFDGVVNLAESRGALTLTGTAPADSTRVEVQWLGQTYPATLNGNGTWSLQFPAGLATASQMSEIRVTAWDAANNSNFATLPVRIDLETALSVEQYPVGNDQVLSGSEQRSGFTLDGEGEAGARVYLNLNGTDFGPVLVPDSGIWSYTFTGTDLQGLAHGQQATITAYAIDAAGNRSTPDVTRSFTLDTQVGDFTFAAPDLQLGATPDSPRDATVLNATERSAGLPIEGTVEPGATVTLRVVETGWTTTIPASQTQGGTWNFTLPAAALPQGAAQTATISATATDAQGNTTLPQERSIAIDTIVADFNAADIRLGTGTDNILNAREHAIGLPVEGRAEAGSTISVTMNGHTERTTANAQGFWSVTFTPDQIPTGERTGIPVSVTATDTAGNVSETITRSFDLDTVAPSTPRVFGAEDVDGGYRGITTSATPDQYSFFRVGATGAPEAITARETFDADFNEDRFSFLNGQIVPDGSYLVINTRDAAGNDANTLFIKNTSTGVEVNLNRAGLETFDFSAIDLTRAPNARLTITADQLESLTGPDQTLIIKGDGNDMVTLRDVNGPSVRETINGQVYDIYTLGDSGARILLEDDVSRTVIV